VVKSICRIITGIGVCVSVVTAVLVFFAFVRIFDVPGGFGWRFPYVLNFFVVLVVFALSLIVTIGASKLGTASQEETIFLRVKAIEADKKIDEMKKEIDSLRKKLRDMKDSKS